MQVKIKYFEGAKHLEAIEQGNWIDVYANETVFIPEGCNRRIRLGFAMELPKGYEGHLLPRSSTYDKWGIILANHMGVIDTSYCGDNDEWMFNAICTKPLVEEAFKANIDGVEHTIFVRGSLIHKGDKIGQIRIVKSQEPVAFETVESLGNKDRGGYGTTGTK